MNEEHEHDNNSFIAKMRSHLYRWDCPPPENLGDYTLDLLRAAERQPIARHLTRCLLCRQELEILIEALDNTALPEPQGPTRFYYPTYSHTPQTTVSRLRGDTNLRCFTFETADGQQVIELFLGLRPFNDKYNLNGQFALTADTESVVEEALVEVWQNGQLAATALVDDLATFVCTLDTNKPFTLRVTTRANGILFGRIELDS